MTASAPLTELVELTGGVFCMGSDRFYSEERPAHERRIGAFAIERHPVTNAQYAAFVSATGYVTVAERDIDPADFPGADPAMLVPGALVFTPTAGPVDLTDWRAWWRWQPGASWRHPLGPATDLVGHGDHPVTQIAYADAVARLDAMTQALAAPAPSTVSRFDRPAPDFRVQRTREEYGEIVTGLVREIEAGEAFQVVPSMRFEIDTDADPLDVYRILRASNPSPYMYLLRMPGVGTDDSGAPRKPFTIVGSSPEALVTVTDRVATTHPIAGTRWRGATEEEDQLLGKELSEDEKENAEHLMLVDLGRNDLGRVCAPGTVKVSDYRHIERYSHVMHLVSTVSGTLRDDKHALDAVTACFPAGTLTGAPKVRAMELIEANEKTRRGLYGVIVGYLDFAGNADTAIAIRTALMRTGIAYVQSGGGVVADSEPDYEYNEARNKATAVLNAIAAATTMRRVGVESDGVESDR